MINIGTHKARACAAEFGTSKTKGTFCVEVDFQITEGPNAGEHITWAGYFTEASTQRTLESLRYCGCQFPGGDLMNLEGIGDQEIALVVEHETYESQSGEQKVRAKAQWVNKAGGGFFATKLEGSARADFARRMKGEVLAVMQANPLPKVAPRAAAAPPAAAPRPLTNGVTPRRGEWDGTGADPADDGRDPLNF
jgi:hypothetical protein